MGCVNAKYNLFNYYLIFSIEGSLIKVKLINLVARRILKYYFVVSSLSLIA